MFIRTSCYPEFEDLCTVPAGYLSNSFIPMQSLQSHESRRPDGGRNKIEVLLLCALFNHNASLA